MVDGLPDSHQVQVVGELLSAIQADHVGFAVGHTRLADRSHRAGQSPMAATEHQVQKAVDHRAVPISGPRSRVLILTESAPGCASGHTPSGWYRTLVAHRCF